MYEALEKEAKKFIALRNNPTAATLDKESIDSLCAALSEAAQEISDLAQTSTSQMDSANLAKLYQGLLAAKRIVENLYQEGRAATLIQLTQQALNINGASMLS